MGVSVFTHGVNLLVMVVDLLSHNIPMTLSHYLYPVFTGFVYSLFAITYFLAGGTYQNGTSPYIYKVLDFTYPEKAIPILLGTVFVLTPLCHIFFVLIDMCKKR